VESCPACSQVAISRWRRFFSRTERFRCPRCSTWLRYQKAKSPPSLFLRGIRSHLLRAVVLILGLQLFLLASSVAVAYGSCFLAQVPDRWFIPGMGLLLVAGIVFSERSILRRLRLVVAERQMPKPQWDVLRNWRVVMAAGAGWKPVGGLVLCLALLFGGLVSLRPILFALAKRWPIPCACVKPGRSGPPALPRCSA
jgi:hypothetical protein